MLLKYFYIIHKNMKKKTTFQNTPKFHFRKYPKTSIILKIFLKKRIFTNLNQTSLNSSFSKVWFFLLPDKISYSIKSNH